MKRIEDTELAYLAGIVDGEGCITTDVKGQPRIVIAMHTSSIPKHIHNLIPGGTYRQADIEGRIRYTWGVYSKPMVRGVLEAIMPYLILKKDQAHIATQLCDVPKGSYYPDLVHELSRLKRIDHETL